MTALDSAPAPGVTTGARGESGPGLVLPGPAALLIIDMQKAFDDPVWQPRNNPEAEAIAGRLLAAWRDSRRLVIHVQHLSREPGSSYRPDGPGVEFKDEVRPRAGEIVVQKRTNNAFIDTGLEALLHERGIASLVTVGVITNNSVEATVRMAGNLGFTTYVVADATATIDKQDLDGRLWPADEVQALSLANMAGEYATVTDSRSVLAALG